MNDPPPLASATVRPSRARHAVVAFLMGLAMVTYLDRACIGALAPAISANLSLSKEQMSWVFSAFALAYTLFELPTAAWADRRGTHGTLTRIVLWWSAFTLATGAALNFASLVATRFLFGAGEAGAWPCVARTFSRWIPRAERGQVQGIFFAGAHLAGGLAPFFALTLSEVFGWRAVFFGFGLVGVAWTVGWAKWFRDEPADHPAVNAAELALITSGRGASADHVAGRGVWHRLLRHRNTLPLCLAYIPNSCVFYFCITWFPTYLQEKHHFDGLELKIFSGLPLLLAIAGDILGGWVTDAVTRRFGLRLGRAGVCGAGNLLAGLAMTVAAFATNGYLAVGLISLAVVATMFTLAATWATCLELGGPHVGVVSAAMNTTGQIGTIVSPPLMTKLLAATGNWNNSVLVLGVLLLLGAACWSRIDPRKRIFE